MAPRDIRAGGAFVEFSLRRKGLERSLRQVGQRLKQFGGQVRQIGASLAAAGGAISAPFAASLAIFQKYGDTLDKTSQRTGIAVESLSELRFAAEQSGSSLEVFEKAIKSSQRSIVDLGRGLSTQKDAFDSIGLTFKDLDGLSPEDQFTLIADRVGKVEDPTKKAAAAMQIFGRAGQQLIPLLTGGEQSIAALREEASALGLTVDNEATQAAAALGDAFNVLKSQIRVIAFNIGSALAPQLESTLNSTRELVRGIIDFVKANADLIRTVASIGAALVAAGTVFIGLGTAIGIAGFAVTSFAAALAFVLSPLGLAIAAIGGATAAVLKFSDVGGQAVEFLRGKFTQLLDIVSITLGGIRDAFIGGDIKLAVAILWNTLKLIFFEGSNDLIQVAIDLKSRFLTALTEITIGAIQAGSDLFEGLQKSWNKINAAARTLWTNVSGDAREAFNLVELRATQAANKVAGAIDDSFDVAAANRAAEKRFVEQQKNAQANRKATLDAIEEARKAEIARIKANAEARKKSIQESLKLELDAIKKTKSAESTRLRNEIQRLRDQQERLIRAANLKAIAARQAIADVGEDERVPVPDNPAAAVAAVGRAAGITSSFDIRALDRGDDINRRNLNANEQAVKELKSIKERLSGEFLPLNIT